ncbi:DUF3367 domain-containing protein [Candidatus Daviesbacteria bacterium]|nr:DUF3367 domain-containing protein [Candidatus Daviesbacteria bacterium]
MRSILLLLAVLAIASSILVFTWFKDGLLLGTAESQISFYNLSRFHSQVKGAWSDTNSGLGFANGIVTAYSPTFFALSLLEKIGVANYIIEAGLFWFFLVVSGVGITLFTREFFPHIGRKYLVVAVIFYWFNSISLVNIWNRFLYNYIAFWALLPLVSAFYIKGLQKQNFYYVSVVGITCAVFSLGLSNPVFNIILWFIFTYFTLFKFITVKTTKERIFSLSFIAINLIYFSLVNLWWIGQVVRSLFIGKYSEELSSFFQFDVSLSTLTASSKTLGDLTYLFRLFHGPFFTTPQIEWPKLFSMPAAVVIEFLVSAVILIFIFQARKNINVLALAVLFFLSLYFAKGNNPPFGELFQFLFINISPLQFFRNPFEKFGFITLLAAVPLLAAGLEGLLSKFQKKLHLAVYTATLFIIVALYGYPFWSGLVFTGFFPPTDNYSVGYKVKVPQYYEQANNWLKFQGNNFRFIGFPFSGQGVTYNWEKGYQGIETSMWLFDTPHIMSSTTILYFDKVADQLEELFVSKPKFYEVMNVLNAKYLLIRSDVDIYERKMRDPQTIQKIAMDKSKKGELVKTLSFGKLEFWENPFWTDKSLYVTGNLMDVSPTVQLKDFTFSEASSAGTAISNISYLDDLVNLRVIHPDDLKNPERKPGYYKFDIKNSGKYELISDKLSEPGDILVDGVRLQGNPVLREDGRWSYGELNLTEGLHTVIINISYSGNLTTLSDDKNSFTVLNINPFSKYLVSFDYSTLQEKKLVISFDNDQKEKGKIRPYHMKDLTTTTLDRFESFNDLFEARSTASALNIYFWPDLDNLKVKNMNVRELMLPDLVLINKLEDRINKTPNLSYDKISPSRYNIRIENSLNPFVVVFSSIFNSGWQLSYPDGTKVEKHFLTNSFANGWLIDRLGDFDLNLEYSLQNDLDKDSLISQFALISGLIITLWVLFKKIL